MNDRVSTNRETRDRMLARIRAHTQTQPPEGGSFVAAGQSNAEAAPSVPRPGNLSIHAAGQAALKERFVRFALAGSSTLDEIASRDELPGAVARYLITNQLPRRLAMWSEFVALDWPASGIEAVPRAAEKDDTVGLTGVFCALAETGTLLVLSGQGTAASTSLLPETHIAVVPVSRIVAGMEEAFALIAAERGALPRALNFISGPSRTGDIEQTIVLGAHGPSRVHLILLNDGSAG